MEAIEGKALAIRDSFMENLELTAWEVLSELPSKQLLLISAERVFWFELMLDRLESDLF